MLKGRNVKQKPLPVDVEGQECEAKAPPCWQGGVGVGNKCKN